MVANGSIDVNAEPTLVSPTSPTPFAIERWDGNLGPGNLSAHSSMRRAIALARQHGLGCIALANTNHWMRGGSYGWLAADSGLFAVCWTNTLANLPPWGSSTPALGNNPLVLAVPRSAGEHVVLDMAMSQFSYGALAAYTARGQQLPVPGGYNQAGNLTTDPAAIEASKRALAIGYWKGSALSLVLDMFAAMLSGGRATHQIPLDPTRESGVSQVFLAIDPTTVADPEELDRTAAAILASLRAATPIDPAHPTRYPGEQTLRLRHENLSLGVPVTPAIWQQLQSLSF
jgi:3-dehydro-L-gulonate 2-dehydrogenase